MGLFSDKCVNPACDQRISKDAKFCPKCGTPAPRGRLVCGACGAEARGGAKFCRNCGAELPKTVDEARVDDAAERTRLNVRLRETLTADQMDFFKSGKDLEQFIRQTEHEIGLKDVIRDDEMQRLAERFTAERDREGLLRRLEVQSIADAAAREDAWKDLLAREQRADETRQHALEGQLAQARNDAEKQKITLEMDRLDHEQDVRQAEDGLMLLDKTRLADHAEAVRKQELEAKQLADRSQATAAALLTIVDGPGADRIVKIEELRARQNMTPDQILALAAQASPEAAKALAAKYTADGQLSAEKARLLEKQLADQQKLADGYADRMERVMQAAMGSMGDVATARARDVRPTVVMPAGGSPVVIGGPGGGSSCKNCGGRMDPAGDFCPQCGKKV